MGEYKRGSSCGGACPITFTVLFALTWLLLVIGTLVNHMAIADLVPVIKDLPTNLKKGFDDEFKFKRLEEDAESVQSSSLLAMRRCVDAGRTDVQVRSDCEFGRFNAPTGQPSPGEALLGCPSFFGANPTTEVVPCGDAAACCNPQTRFADVDNSASLDSINAAFSRSLAIIKKVTSDKYFGVDGLAGVASDLEAITEQMNNLTGEDNCFVTNIVYCEIYKNSAEIVSGASTATKAVDDLIDNEFVQQLEDNAESLQLAHLLPYLLWISMLFFTVFWWKDAALCCCGGGCCGCIALVFHWLFWQVFLVVNVILVAVGLAFTVGADSEESREALSNAGLKETPTLRELMDHIATTYPEFFNTVIAPLEDPLLAWYNAYLMFLGVANIIVVYGFCVCLCRPYREDPNRVLNIDEAGSRDANIVPGPPKPEAALS